MVDYFLAKADSDLAKRVLIERGVEDVLHGFREAFEDTLCEFFGIRHCLTRPVDLVELNYLEIVGR